MLYHVRHLTFNKGYAPFFFPYCFITKKNWIFQKILSEKALIGEGIPIGINYGCIVFEWKWASKFFHKKLNTSNAIETRDKCFHLYINEKKIAIIGAGIAGLTLANLIKRNSDHEFMLYEKNESLSLDEGYGIQLSTNCNKNFKSNWI